jgi:hypothetical protein
MRSLPEWHVARNYRSDGGRTDSEPSCSLSCACGNRVRCEVMRYGDALGEIVFFDDQESSITYGERVGYCPGCHDRLSIASLRP